MSTVRESILPVVDRIRGVVLDTVLGLRTTNVILRTETWDGGRVGKGFKSTVDTPITPRPKVIHHGQSDYEIRKITPAWVDGVVTGGWSVPSLVMSEVPGVIRYLVLVGPDGHTREADIVATQVHKNFEYILFAHDRR